MELLAQLIHAEAGNQDIDGKRLVADVVLNRVDAGFENNIEAVIYQSGQFSSITDGNFDKAFEYILQLIDIIPPSCSKFIFVAVSALHGFQI